jgi:hypothetical protein
MTRSSEAIAFYLERPVSESERGSIPTLNDVGGELLETLRGWPRPYAMLYGPHCLEFFVAEHEGVNWMQIEGRFLREQFVEDIYDRKAEPAEWKRGPAFFGLDRIMFELQSVDVASVISDLATVPGDRYYQMVYAGGTLAEIGVIFADYRYWMTPNKSAPHVGPGRIVDLSKMELRSKDGKPMPEIRYVPESDLPVALRRWQALMFQRIAGEDYWAAGNPTAESLAHRLMHFDQLGRPKENLGEHQPTADALIAMRALIAEYRLNSPDFAQRAGALGPDEWYR